MADKTWENSLALHNGHMFSMLRKDGVLGMRLSKEDHEAFKKEHGVGDFENYGAKIREYAEIPERVLKTRKNWPPDRRPVIAIR